LWVIGNLDSLVIADELVSLVDEAARFVDDLD
jgi:hypothetical protein